MKHHPGCDEPTTAPVAPAGRGRPQDSKSAQPAVSLAFEFLVLTAARSSEGRLATWDQIDMEDHVWTIPATRMKMHREHRVPLSARAVEVLDAARTFAGGNPLVFPNRGATRSRAGSVGVLRNLDIPAVPHGFRSSLRDWTSEETDHPREVIEAALAHSVRNRVEGPNARSDLFARRRLLMDDWAKYVDGRDHRRGDTAADGAAPFVTDRRGRTARRRPLTPALLRVGTRGTPRPRRRPEPSLVPPAARMRPEERGSRSGESRGE